MNFLQQFLSYKDVYIQCHNNPDADSIASAFGLYYYFKQHGIKAQIIYGGTDHIKKYNLLYMINQCEIPICHVDTLQAGDLLIIVDGQYKQGNVVQFDAPALGVIDHHTRLMHEKETVLIKSDYQSCSTIIWELLEQEGYCVKDSEALRVALLYGLYTDTSSFNDLYTEKDLQMRKDLMGTFDLFEKLIKSNMTVAEMLIASDAMQDHYFDTQRRFAIVSAMRCDQSILGVIGDFMIQVDVILVNFCFTSVAGGYQISIRSCDNNIKANLLAEFICKDVGSGGGHAQKAGGRISSQKLASKYGKDDLFSYVNGKLCEFIQPITGF